MRLFDSVPEENPVANRRKRLTLTEKETEDLQENVLQVVKLI